MTALHAPHDPLDAPPAPVRVGTPEYDWPPSPLLELWALRVRIDALCRKGEAREGWVSCRVLRRAMS